MAHDHEHVLGATIDFVGVVLCVIGDKLMDTYLCMHNAELWDVLKTKLGASSASNDDNELYDME